MWRTVRVMMTPALRRLRPRLTRMATSASPKLPGRGAAGAPSLCGSPWDSSLVVVARCQQQECF